MHFNQNGSGICSDNQVQKALKQIEGLWAQRCALLKRENAEGQKESLVMQLTLWRKADDWVRGGKQSMEKVELN